MARKLIDIGVEGNDGTGDSIRESFRKTNENFFELYAVFGQGGQIKFTNLDDAPSSYNIDDANKVVAINTTGTGLRFKELVAGDGVGISSTNDTVTITNTGSNLFADSSPELSYHLNASFQMIGYIKNPDPVSVGEFNTTFGTNLNTDGRDFAITKGYADTRFVNINGDIMTGPLSVPAGATGTQVPRSSETVLKSGGTMSGTLFLNDHPTPMEGVGTPRDTDDLQAATKYYVDNSTYTSDIDLYVSLSGSDEQTYTPVGKEGRSWKYAYKTINKAAQRALEIMEASPWEPGPYRQLIGYNSGAAYSEVTGSSTNVNGTVRVFFQNGGGGRVDQGDPANIDLISGKIVVGRTSGAKGYIYQYYGSAAGVPGAPANSDYFDLEDVDGTFISGENLEFGEPVKYQHITMYVESGIYFEDFPIKLPQNVSIVGDEFRRTIVRPADRVSRSPWVTTWFRRDTEFDGIAVTDTEYGYHYLTDPSDRLSTPKNNRDIDVFLCNDAVIVRQVTVQGHGGFYMVLDPEGQILSKSPYCQQGSSFSRSENKQAFRGGQYVDGFAGNLNVTVESKISNTVVEVSGAERAPNTPCSFVVNGETYQVDAYTDDGNGDGAARRLILKNRDFLKAELIGYINSELTPEFVFNRAKCSRDIGYLIDAVGYDLLYNTNYRSIKAGLAYYRGAQYSVLPDQKSVYLACIDYIISLVNTILASNVTAKNRAVANLTEIKDIVNNGTSAANAWSLPSVSGTTPTAVANTRDIVISNINFLKAEVIAFINTVYNSIDYPTFSYDPTKCSRDVEYIVYAGLYDLIYGGNSQIVDAGLNYYNGLGELLIPNQTLQTTGAIDYLKTILGSVIVNTTIPVENLYQSGVAQVSGTAGTSTQVTSMQNLLSIVNTIILGGPSSAPAITNPSTTGVDSGLTDSQNLLINATPSIQSDTLAFIDNTYSYNQSVCARDAGYIIDAIAHDIYYSGNLKTVQAALAYFKKSDSASVVLSDQLTNTLAALNYLNIIIVNAAYNDSPTVRYQSEQVQYVDPSLVADVGTETIIDELFAELTGVIGGVTGFDDARELLVLNKEFIKSEVSAWIDAQILAGAGIWSGFTLTAEQKATCARDVGFIVANISSDLLYGGCYNTVRAALRYYAGSAAAVISGQLNQTIAALNFAKSIAVDVLNQDTVVPLGAITQVFDPSLNGTAAEADLIILFDTLVAFVTNPVTATAPNNVFEYPVYHLILNANTPYAGAYPDEIMLLSAGNNSMLANDFTQVNDLAYGLVATNNGGIETVSMFTYYCWTAYYACNGGQIRSVAGSNAYGTYGIVAEGSDPLEVPDNVTLLENQVQVAKVYKRNAYSTSGIEAGFDFYIDSFGYIPYNSGYIEINHGSTIGIKRYSLSSISDGSADSGEAPTPADGTIIRVQLTVSNIAGVTNGLAADLTDGQFVTIQAGQQQVWYNVRETQPTRPSTALTYLGDAADNDDKPVYRVISYSTLDSLGRDLQSGRIPTAITNGNPIQVTTSTAHGFSNGDRILFSKIKGITELDGNIYYAKTTANPNVFQIYSNSTLTTPVNGATYGTFVADSLSQVIKNGDRVTLETDEAYDFVQIDVNLTHTTDTDTGLKTLGSKVGDTKIAIDEVTDAIVLARLNTGQMLFSWSGKIHRIVSYTDQTGWGIISISDTSSTGAALQDLNGVPVTGLAASVDPNTNPALVSGAAPSLNIGLPKDEPADITVKISTCRVTGHDFLDIGTGGYNTSNFPNKIYGSPVEAVKPSNQAVERRRGRTFYVSTDQDGFFRVGRFFMVDQGTGEVGFDVGRLSLEGVTGLKFKKGVRVTEFSPDSNFTLANDFRVPTQLAVQNYLDRRLGLTRDNALPSLTIGGGFLDRGGLLAATNDLDIGGFKITNLEDPTELDDAATKNYVIDQPLSDSGIAGRKVNFTVTAVGNNQVIIHNGTSWVNAAQTGDVTFTVSGNTATSAITANSIIDGDVSETAAIKQSKLKVNRARAFEADGISISAISKNTETTITTGTTAHTLATGDSVIISGATGFTNINGQWRVTDVPNGTSFKINLNSSALSGTYTANSGKVYIQGMSTYNSKVFSASTNGFVDLASSSSETTGILLSKVQYIGASTILGNLETTAGVVDQLTPGEVVTAGDGIKNASFTSDGAMTVDAGTPNTYSVTGITTTGDANSLVKTDASGNIDVKQLKIDTKKIIDTASTSTEFYTPGEGKFIDAAGATGSISINANGALTVYGNISTSGANTDITAVRNVSAGNQVSGVAGSFSTSVTTPLLTTGAAATSGVVTGNWTLSSGSKFQATYADLAEYYEGDREYPVGTVLVFGGDKEVTLTSIFGDRRVAGVVSENAAYIMNAECPGTKICVALQGRVPVKVLGRVQKGDLLVTSAKPGYAIVNNDPKTGTIIGKAIQGKDDAGEGIIEVAVGRL